MYFRCLAVFVASLIALGCGTTKFSFDQNTRDALVKLIEEILKEKAQNGATVRLTNHRSGPALATPGGVDLVTSSELSVSSAVPLAGTATPTPVEQYFATAPLKVDPHILQLLLRSQAEFVDFGNDRVRMKHDIPEVTSKPSSPSLPK